MGKKTLRNIIIGFIVSFVFIIAVSLYGLRQFSSLNNYSSQLNYGNQLISRIHKLEGDIKDIDVLERGYMLTRDSSYLQALFLKCQQLPPETETLKSLLLEQDKDQAASLTLMRIALYQRISAAKDNIASLDSLSGPHMRSSFFLEGVSAGKESLDLLKGMREKETSRLDQYFQHETQFQHTTFTLIQYLLIVFTGLILILFIILIQELKKSTKYQEALQAKIADSHRSHKELEQIAHAVSHDLQEPLRKIQLFSNRLMYVKKDFDQDQFSSLDRIHRSAVRMNDLITDLANITSLIKEKNKDAVNLNLVLEKVIKELNEKIAQHQVYISADKLPEIQGYQHQLNMLFKCLLDNAIKFTSGEEHPFISIRYDKVKGGELKDINTAMQRQHFHRISISDNGIGFDNKFGDKIFKIFQRLHNQQSAYGGKGIGLAICQRVMVNHSGYILAFGHMGVGATFRLYFPVQM